MHGFLNINKPSGMTSHDVVSKLRKITGIKHIGHAGTLDPLASGVLPVAIGKAAKLIDYLPSDKRYTAGIEFGKTSDTYDTEGQIQIVNAAPVTLERIKPVLSKFTGIIKQCPPVYSAVHYNGKRLYELAREGKIPDDIQCRTVTVYRNSIMEFYEASQRLVLDISCSKGTYIRTIAHDLGLALNTGAVMYSLIRTEASGMNIKSALTFDETLTKEVTEKNLINPAAILSMICLEIDEKEYKIVINGNKFRNRFNAENNVLLTHNGILTALAHADNIFIQPKKLLI